MINHDVSCQLLIISLQHFYVGRAVLNNCGLQPKLAPRTRIIGACDCIIRRQPHAGCPHPMRCPTCISASGDSTSGRTRPSFV
jgi:hypothetical protein